MNLLIDIKIMMIKKEKVSVTKISVQWGEMDALTMSIM